LKKRDTQTSKIAKTLKRSPCCPLRIHRKILLLLQKKKKKKQKKWTGLGREAFSSPSPHPIR
jgi:hypothetical protein